MTTNQEDLAHAAKKRQQLYEELNQAKYNRPPAPEVSTQGANQQKAPANHSPSGHSQTTPTSPNYSTNTAQTPPDTSPSPATSTPTASNATEP